MNSSDLANCSPRQARFPVRQKQQNLFSCHRYVTNYLLQSLYEFWDWDSVASMHLCLASALCPQNIKGKSAGSQISWSQKTGSAREAQHRTIGVKPELVV